MELQEDNIALRANRGVNICMGCFLVLMTMIGVYLLGVGLTIGYVVLANPEYDFSTGCPKNNNDCGIHVKMSCNAKSLMSCFVLAPLPAVMIMLVVVVIVSIVAWVKSRKSYVNYDGYDDMTI